MKNFYVKAKDFAYLKKLGYFDAGIYKATFFICSIHFYISNVEKFIAKYIIGEVLYSARKSEQLCSALPDLQTQNTMTNNRNQIPYRQEDKE
jgi:hypothetical protein